MSPEGIRTNIWLGDCIFCVGQIRADERPQSLPEVKRPPPHQQTQWRASLSAVL